MNPSPIPVERIENRILLVRGQKVLLDADLAALYGVTTKRFNEQVRRNAERFPADFMFQLFQEEWISLRTQFATLKAGRGQHRKYLPQALSTPFANLWRRPIPPSVGVSDSSRTNDRGAAARRSQALAHRCRMVGGQEHMIADVALDLVKARDAQAAGVAAR